MDIEPGKTRMVLGQIGRLCCFETANGGYTDNTTMIGERHDVWSGGRLLL